jgi:hypothetical protein
MNEIIYLSGEVANKGLCNITPELGAVIILVVAGLSFWLGWEWGNDN